MLKVLVEIVLGRDELVMELTNLGRGKRVLPGFVRKYCLVVVKNHLVQNRFVTIHQVLSDAERNFVERREDFVNKLSQNLFFLNATTIQIYRFLAQVTYFL